VNSITGLNALNKYKSPIDASNTTKNLQYSSQLLESLVHIPLRVWICSLVFLGCYIGNGLYDVLITSSEESYRVCLCVSNCG
jgi:hypothetical protein